MGVSVARFERRNSQEITLWVASRMVVLASRFERRQRSRKMVMLPVLASVLESNFVGKRLMVSLVSSSVVTPSVADAHFEKHCFDMIQVGTKLTSNTSRLTVETLACCTNVILSSDSSFRDSSRFHCERKMTFFGI
jgi:hypothetical protein